MNNRERRTFNKSVLPTVQHILDQKNHFAAIMNPAPNVFELSQQICHEGPDAEEALKKRNLAVFAELKPSAQALCLAGQDAGMFFANTEQHDNN